MGRLLGLAYEYDPPADAAQAESGEREDLAGDRLARVPPEWRESMRRALSEADRELALALVDQITTQDGDLAQNLRERLQRYAFEEIEKALGSTAPR